MKVPRAERTSVQMMDLRCMARQREENRGLETAKRSPQCTRHCWQAENGVAQACVQFGGHLPNFLSLSKKCLTQMDQTSPFHRNNYGLSAPLEAVANNG
jgi:hypothetical protein